MTHICHRPGCGKALSPSLVACRDEWYELPRPIRDAIWKHYRRGQEHDKSPSREYVVALAAALNWWMVADILAVCRKAGLSLADLRDVRYRLERTKHAVLKDIWEKRATLFDAGAPA